jgi:uncharacterized membrane protein YkvA (DUF1232 family)
MQTREGKNYENMAREALLLIPNFIKLLYRMVVDQRVMAREKAILLGTMAYVISPLDFLPDVIPFIGQIDDLLLLALILNRFLNSVDRSVVLEFWDGSENLLVAVHKILDFTRYLLPQGVYEKVVKKARQDFIDADYEIKS